MSLDHDVLEGLKFMVAYANDAIFIAFSGTTTPQRLAKTLQMDNHDMKFHAGFFKRANVFMGPGHKNIMHELLSSGKRIIFCGHSSGGAVAHMVLLRILLEDNWIPDENTFLDSMISVAFGAPHVCDKEAARIVNENEKFKWRFINFVNQSDPIPCLLHNPQKIVAAIGGKINCHDDVVVAAIRATFDIGTSHPAGEIRDLLARRVLPPKSTFKTSDQTESDFSPVGYYIFLKRESTEHRDGRYDVHVITSAKLKTIDADRRYISITGKNLLFLRAPVNTNGKEVWLTNTQEDNRLLILEDKRNTVTSQRTDLLMVIVKTAFGESSKPVIEDIWDEPATNSVCKLLPKILQAMILKAYPPLGIRPADVHLQALDEIIQCAPGLQNRTLSKTLKQIHDDARGKIEGPIDERIKRLTREANDTVKAVTKILTSGLLICNKASKVNEDGSSDSKPQTEDEMGDYKRFLSILPLIPIVMAGYVVSKVRSMFKPSETIIDEYNSVLRIACWEASAWSNSPSTFASTVPHEVANEVTLLEQALITRVHESNDEFKELIRNAHCFNGMTKKKKCPKFKHKFLRKAKSQSRINLLKRIKVVVDTKTMYDKVVEGTRYVAFLGAEDVGKSTFIKNVLERFDPGRLEMPKCGTDIHTSKVTAYNVNNTLCLVDFPGGNGLGGYADEWKQFAALPSSCVLLLNFQHDIKKDQKEMYLEIKKSLGTQITVAFNKVGNSVTDVVSNQNED
ncbi:unnamed protein product [Sphagnum balticum]